MLYTHRLHLSRYDTSPLLCLQPLLIMLLVFHGTLVWKHSSLLPRNVSFCWKQLHIHSTCIANQQQLVLEAESPPVWHHQGKKRRISRWILYPTPDLRQRTPYVPCQESIADQKVSKSSCETLRIRSRPAQVCQLFPMNQEFKINFKTLVKKRKKKKKGVRWKFLNEVFSFTPETSHINVHVY